MKLQGRKGEESRFGNKAEVANDNDSRFFTSRFTAVGVRDGGDGGDIIAIINWGQNILICC